MVIQNPEFLVNNSEIHLRDARHAHNFYVQHSHSFTPKVKFLYHIVFDLKDSFTRSRAPNSDEFKKQIAVLAKSVELPKFRATLNVKQQYNRKKNVQTRVDYDEVTMVFHDDNVGITRALLEEYYLYYFRDGNKNDGNGFPLGYESRDTYRALTHKYGMDNYDVKSPFFGYIKIFQLSRQQWHSYTLINPILSSWGHDTLDYSDSQPTQNTISVAYEGVLYNFGEINEQSDPAGFANQETAYDQIHSPLTTNENEYGQAPSGANSAKFAPRLNEEYQTDGQQRLFNVINKAREPSNLLSQLNTSNTSSGIQQIIFPFTDRQNLATASTISTSPGVSRDANAINKELKNDAVLLNSVIARAVGTGTLNPARGPGSLNTANLSEADRENLSNQVINGISNNNKKLIKLASTAIANRNRSNTGIG